MSTGHLFSKEIMGDNASKANLEGLPGHICDRGRPCNLITQACDEAALSGNIVESSQLYDRANLILAECKKAAPISALNTAIDQFREALDQRPAPHPLRSNSLKNLAAALVSRFSHTNRREDLDDALFLLCDKMQHQWQDVLQRMTGTKDQSRFDVRVRSNSKFNVCTYHLRRGNLPLNTTACSL